MTGRYEIKDREHMDWRGQRFSSLTRADVELAQSVPGGRFYIYDRETRQRCTGTTDHRGVFGHDGETCPLHEG